jgi:putative ABC transport system substrate-binding protein
MKAKILVYVLPALILATIHLAEAQQQAKVAKIGWLTSSATGNRALWQALRELGYVEGKNITIEYGQADNKLDRLPALVEEMVRLKVDVLVAASTPAALAAKKATRTIPIVFYNVSDPVAAELVDSLARPGGNITGFTSIAAVLAGKRLELLKETVPKLSRVAVLWNPQDLGSTQQWKRANWRDATWVCNFIPWRQAAPTNTTVRSTRQSRLVMALLPLR